MLQSEVTTLRELLIPINVESCCLPRVGKLTMRWSDMSSTATSYKYKKLENDTKFRLMTLLPGGHRSALKHQISHRSLYKNHHTKSYLTDGPFGTTRPICIAKDRLVQIYIRLYVAYVVPIVNVSCVFPKSVSCEEDIDEHQHQVSLMSDILPSPVPSSSGLVKPRPVRLLNA
jgi:hypothetical protein